MLNSYLTSTQDLLHDAAAAFYSTQKLTRWINSARQQVAADAECIRVLADGNSGLNTVAGQEVYPFSTANAIVSLTPGVKGVISVRQIAVFWGNLKPACAYEPWTRFNAFYRAYNFALMNFPSVWSQYGQGESGSVYLWPIPAQTLGMDWDCTCLPIDLANDTDIEAIPSPWTRAVSYWAAKLAFQNAQRFEDADLMLNRYKMELMSHRANVQRSVTPNWYYG